MENLTSNFLGCLFLATSCFDAVKYRWNASKIRTVGTSRGHSRQFINVAILNDIVRTAYGASVHDWYIIGSSLLALIFMLDLFYTIYIFYPFKNRYRKNYKRPNFLLYFINSITPNSISKKL